MVTPRGGIRLEALPGLRPIAFETITTQSWSQRVAFCLPEAESAMNRRAVLTELGPDTQALARARPRCRAVRSRARRPAGRLLHPHAESVELINGLRAHAGRSLFAPGNPAMGLILATARTAFSSRARAAPRSIQGIPAPGGKAPEGPHTHVLPKLLAHGRTHAATEPIPQGWVSCAHLYPAHPLRDGYGRTMPFDAARHAAFQSLLAQFGDPAHVRVKTGVAAALMAGEHPDGSLTERFTRAAVRVALRQARATGAPARSLPAWLAAYDAQQLAEDESEELADA